MKKTLLGLFILGSSLSATDGTPPEIAKYHEQPRKTATLQPASQKESACRVHLGGNYTYMKLKPKNLSSYSGSLGGAQGSFQYLPKNSYYGGLQFLWRLGTLDSHSNLKREILDMDTQIRSGYSFSIEEKTDLTGFTGFGWRYIGQVHTQPGQEALHLN
jgi:hypothetical protein